MFSLVGETAFAAFHFTIDGTLMANQINFAQTDFAF